MGRWVSRDPIGDPGFTVATVGGQGRSPSVDHDLVVFAQFLSDSGYGPEEVVNSLQLMFDAHELTILAWTRPLLWSVISHANPEALFLFVHNEPTSRVDPFGLKDGKKK